MAWSVRRAIAGCVCPNIPPFGAVMGALSGRQGVQCCAPHALQQVWYAWAAMAAMGVVHVRQVAAACSPARSALRWTIGVWRHAGQHMFLGLRRKRLA